MIEKKFRHCEALIEKGLFVDALIEIRPLSKQIWLEQGEYSPAIRERLDRLMNRADAGCSKDPSATREKLVQLIQSTDSFPIFDACVGTLLHSGEYSTLISCRTMEVNLNRDGFNKGNLGHSDFIDRALLEASMGTDAREIGEAHMFGDDFSLKIVFADFLFYRRKQDRSGIPTFRPQKRLQLDTKVFAAGYDPVRGRYILTLALDDRVLGVNAKTLETEAELRSPEQGVRGLGIHAGARRGFFNAEFGNVMFSFDLDSFEIRKMIEGFSTRPERIHLDPDSNTLVTGNLGLSWDDSFYIFLQKISSRGKELGGRAVTVVDTEKEEVIDTLPTGMRPTAVGISGKHIIAGNFGENTVFIYGRSDLQRADVVALDLPTNLDMDFELYDKHKQVTINHKKSLYSRMIEGSAILDGRGWVLVACFDVCVLAVIDIETAKVTDYIPVLNRPFDVVADEDEKLAYVSCHSSNAVSVVDLDLKREVGRIEVGPLPVDLTLARDTLLVPDSKGLTIVDLHEAKQSLGL